MCICNSLHLLINLGDFSTGTLAISIAKLLTPLAIEVVFNSISDQLVLPFIYLVAPLPVTPVIVSPASLTKLFVNSPPSIAYLGTILTFAPLPPL